MRKYIKNIYAAFVLSALTCIAILFKAYSDVGGLEVSLSSGLALIIGLVVFAAIYFVFITLIRSVLTAAYKPLVEDFKVGDSRQKILIIVVGLLVLMRLLATTFR